MTQNERSQQSPLCDLWAQKDLLFKERVNIFKPPASLSSEGLLSRPNIELPSEYKASHGLCPCRWASYLGVASSYRPVCTFSPSARYLHTNRENISNINSKFCLFLNLKVKLLLWSKMQVELRQTSCFLLLKTVLKMVSFRSCTASTKTTQLTTGEKKQGRNESQHSYSK